MKRLAALGTSFAIIGLLSLPGVALAAGGSEGDTTVGGTIATYYTLTAPASIDLGQSISTEGEITRGPLSITVATNDASITTCGIGVGDKFASTKGATAGYLVSGGNALASPLFVSGGTQAKTVLVPTGVTLTASSTALAEANVSNFYVYQNISATDLSRAGAYGLTLTFTATFGP